MKNVFCLWLVLFSGLGMVAQNYIDFSSCPGKKFWECYREKIEEVVVANVNKGALKEGLVNSTDKDSINLKMTYWLNSSGKADTRLFGASLKRNMKAFNELKLIINEIEFKKSPHELKGTNGAQFFLSLNFRKVRGVESNIVVLEKFNYEKQKFVPSVLTMSPIHPGCKKPKKINEKTRKKVKVCLEQKFIKLFNKNFDTSLMDGKPLFSNKRIKTVVSFKINKKGKIDDAKAISLTSILENEAIKIMNEIPTMTPGVIDGKNVGVLYKLPIIYFQQ